MSETKALKRILNWKLGTLMNVAFPIIIREDFESASAELDALLAENEACYTQNEAFRQANSELRSDIEKIGIEHEQLVSGLAQARLSCQSYYDQQIKDKSTIAELQAKMKEENSQSLNAYDRVRATADKYYLLYMQVKDDISGKNAAYSGVCESNDNLRYANALLRKQLDEAMEKLDFYNKATATAFLNRMKK
jgi:hypothetical protein